MGDRLLGVLAGIEVDAIGIGLQHTPHIGWQGGIMGLDIGPDPHPTHQIINLRCGRPLIRRQFAARRHHHILHGGKVIFAMGIG